MKLEAMWRALEGVRNFVVTGDTKDSGYDREQLSRLLIVRNWKNLVLLNYSNLLQYGKYRWTDFLRTCRGIVFDRTGNLLSFPFHKFFNINENDEVRYENVATWTTKSVTEKVDGVLIQVFKHDGDIIWASRHYIFTPPAQLAQSLAGDEIHNVIRVLPNRPWTIMLELVHKSVWLPGMVYPGDTVGLYLLGVRFHDSLELKLAFEIWETVPEPFKLPVQYSFNSVDDSLQLVQRANTPDWEGLVLQGTEDAGNRLVKIKSPLYLKRLALVKGLSPKRIIQTYSRGGWDAVNQLLLNIEEVVLQTRLGSVISGIRAAEDEVRSEIEKYANVPLEEIRTIPENMRWVVGYRNKPEKLVTGLRRAVAAKIEAAPDRYGLTFPSDDNFDTERCSE